VTIVIGHAILRSRGHRSRSLGSKASATKCEIIHERITVFKLGDSVVHGNYHKMITYTDIRFLEGQNFGFWGSLGIPPPKMEKICPGPISTITQNFTPHRWQRCRKICLRSKILTKLNIRQNA